MRAARRATRRVWADAAGMRRVAALRHPPVAVGGRPAFHGSTALFQAMLSASNGVATICSARTWECEARYTQDGRNGISTAMLRGDPISQDMQGEVPDIQRDYMRQAEVLSSFWDLSKPVLVTKWVPWVGLETRQPWGRVDGLKHNSVLMKTSGYNEPPHLFRATVDLLNDSRAMPLPLLHAGIRHLPFATVLMYRPWCLWPLSSHAREQRDSMGLARWAAQEVGFMEDLRAKLTVHRAAARPVLLVSLAELLWRPERFETLLGAFAPCLGRVDLSFLPRLGRDIYPDNSFGHVDGSLRSYGESKDPASCCSYDVEAAVCSEPPSARYRGSDVGVRARAEEVEGYLQAQVDQAHRDLLSER